MGSKAPPLLLRLVLGIATHALRSSTLSGFAHGA